MRVRRRHPWPAPSRVVRGGSWNNNPQNLRSANRNRNTPDNRNNNQGFRLASTLTGRVARFTDLTSVPDVRPEPSMMSGRRSGSGAIGTPAAVLREAMARTAAGLTGA